MKPFVAPNASPPIGAGVVVVVVVAEAGAGNETGAVVGAAVVALEGAPRVFNSETAS